MDQSLQRREQPLQPLDHSDWRVIREQAEMLITTNFLPQAIKTAEQAIAIILTGRELGIPTMAALRSIDVIQGKPTVSPQLMLALINRSGQLENLKIEPGTDRVTVTMKRRGRAVFSVGFGKEEATALGLFGKENYKKQAQTMYQWRAVAACARAVFPDVILGLYTHDEMGAVVDADSGELADAPAPARQLAAVPAQTEVTDEQEAEAWKELADDPHAGERGASDAEVRDTLEDEILTLVKMLRRKPQTLDRWILKTYDVPDGLKGLHLTFMSDKSQGFDAYLDELVKIRDQFKVELEAMAVKE